MGGWYSTKTQSTILTPQLVLDALQLVYRVMGASDLARQDGYTFEVALIPQGSATWAYVDLLENPDRVYGDLDLRVIVRHTDDEVSTSRPYLGPINEIATCERAKIRDAQRKLADYFATPRAHVDEDTTLMNGAGLILDVDGAKVQADFLYTLPRYEDWVKFRFTPDRKYKGFVIGSLFSAFAHEFNLSLGMYGVRVKIDKTASTLRLSVPFAQRKNVDLYEVTTNRSSMFDDIYLYQRNMYSTLMLLDRMVDQGMFAVDLPDISGLPYMVTLEQLAEGIKSYIDACYDGRDGIRSGLYGAIFRTYEHTMNAVLNKPKFDKATTSEAMERINRMHLDAQAGSDAVRKIFVG